MRALIKLTLVLLATIAVQCAIEPCIDEVDNAQFVVYVAAAQMRGVPRDDPKLIDAADQLRNREWAREARRHPAEHRPQALPTTTQPVCKDELEF
jgi:hypothetical protein